MLLWVIPEQFFFVYTLKMKVNLIDYLIFA